MGWKKVLCSSKTKSNLVLLFFIQEGGTFYVTTLIIPKQESTSNSVCFLSLLLLLDLKLDFPCICYLQGQAPGNGSCWLNWTGYKCQARNEEEIFTIQNEQSLFPVGWIHVCILAPLSLLLACHITIICFAGYNLFVYLHLCLTTSKISEASNSLRLSLQLP